jgi:hypothetical protein
MRLKIWGSGTFRSARAEKVRPVQWIKLTNASITCAKKTESVLKSRSGRLFENEYV